MAQNDDPFVSTITVTTKGKKSLRTTIPRAVISKVDIQAGDHLEWDIDKIGGNTWVAKARHVRAGTD